jgi:hypothetical protein
MWMIESIRLTSFIEDGLSIKNMENWLENISGHELMHVSKGVTGFSGLSRIDTSILKLEWNNNRIDMIISADNLNSNKEIGSIALFKELCDKYILKYLDMEGCPESKRLALGVILSTPVIDNNDGLEKIKKCIKSVSGINSSEDFMIRINWPKEYEIAGGIQINRLLAWSIGKFQMMKIEIINGLAKSITISSEQELSLRLEMDINTKDIVDAKISIVQQKEIAQTFVDIAEKVSQKGEFGLDK